MTRQPDGSDTMTAAQYARWLARTTWDHQAEVLRMHGLDPGGAGRGSAKRQRLRFIGGPAGELAPSPGKGLVDDLLHGRLRVEQLAKPALEKEALVARIVERINEIAESPAMFATTEANLRALFIKHEDVLREIQARNDDLLALKELPLDVLLEVAEALDVSVVGVDTILIKRPLILAPPLIFAAVTLPPKPVAKDVTPRDGSPKKPFYQIPILGPQPFGGPQEWDPIKEKLTGKSSLKEGQSVSFSPFGRKGEAQKEKLRVTVLSSRFGIEVVQPESDTLKKEPERVIIEDEDWWPNSGGMIIIGVDVPATLCRAEHLRWVQMMRLILWFDSKPEPWKFETQWVPDGADPDGYPFYYSSAQEKRLKLRNSTASDAGTGLTTGMSSNYPQSDDSVPSPKAPGVFDDKQPDHKFTIQLGDWTGGIFGIPSMPATPAPPTKGRPLISVLPDAGGGLDIGLVDDRPPPPPKVSDLPQDAKDQFNPFKDVAGQSIIDKARKEMAKAPTFYTKDRSMIDALFQVTYLFNAYLFCVRPAEEGKTPTLEPPLLWVEFGRVDKKSPRNRKGIWSSSPVPRFIKAGGNFVPEEVKKYFNGQ